MTEIRQTAMQQKIQNSEDRTISWIIHPFFERPVRGMCVVSLLIVLLNFVYHITTSLAWVIFSAFILAISLRQFFFPTVFILCDEHVVCRSLWHEKKMRWEHFKQYFVDKNGVLLSPFQRPSRLENFRGLYLIGANRRHEAMALIEEKLGSVETQ